MLSELFAQNPAQPVLLSMGASVGFGATNHVADVKLVQTLLNAVPSMVGGPAAPLAQDGISGHKTVSAIKTYQQRNTSLVDGRVDPRGQTIRHMVNTLQLRGAVPLSAEGIAPAKPEIVASFRGIGAHFGLPFTASSWRIDSSASVDASVGKTGVYVAELVLVDDNAPGVRVKLRIRAGIVGVSMGLPFGFDFSLPKFPSTGGRIYRGLSGVGELSGLSFAGLCGVSMIGGNSVGVGEGATLIQFGWAAGGPPGAYVGAAMIAGIQGGLPGIGAASGPGLCTPF